MSRSSTCLAVAASLAILLAASPSSTVGAQEPDRSTWESGWHVVRPGDTLEGLADRFLGSSQLWRELHTLNPTIRDPDLLYPGQRVQIFVDRPTTKPSAMIRSVSRQVQELPRPVPWQRAGEGDVLLEKDGLRTEQNSSARLEFDDGANLTLSEDSLVFIRRQSPASAPVARKEIEIQVGQADVDTPATAARPAEIEIVVGDARASSRSAAGGSSRTRSRKSAASDAQFMVYDGSSIVSAAGAKVEVPAGSGTTVAPQAPPTPPERLLAAPAALEPGTGGEFDRSAPRLAWSAVPGAASYTVEVCRDAACGSVVARESGVAGTEVAPREPLDGRLWWRVVAVAPSGLDGFPSPAQEITAVASVAPPVPALVLRRGDGSTVAAEGCVATSPDLEVRASARSGEDLPWDLLVDGQPMSSDEFRRLPLAGRHEIAARVTDERGRSSRSAPARFVLDGAAPWIDIVAAGAPVASEAKGERRRRRKAEPEPPAVCDTGLELGDGNGNWRPLPCATAGAVAGIEVALRGERQAVLLRTTTDGLTMGGLRLRSGESVELAAWDVGCGLRSARFRIGPSPYRAGRLQLSAEVADAAGNSRELHWLLAR
ncbi:MAG: LysM peptidoglycan-binding domain-containing protein [Thermoanaerobaculia bacterium]